MKRILDFLNADNTTKQSQSCMMNTRNPNLQIDHLVDTIEYVGCDSTTVTFVLTPKNRTNQLQDLCKELHSDSHLFRYEMLDEDEPMEEIKPFGYEFLEDYSVQITTEYPDDFIKWLAQVEAITKTDAQKANQFFSDMKKVSLRHEEPNETDSLLPKN